MYLVLVRGEAVGTQLSPERWAQEGEEKLCWASPEAFWRVHGRWLYMGS